MIHPLEHHPRRVERARRWTTTPATSRREPPAAGDIPAPGRPDRLEDLLDRPRPFTHRPLGPPAAGHRLQEPRPQAVLTGRGDGGGVAKRGAPPPPRTPQTPRSPSSRTSTPPRSTGSGIRSPRRSVGSRISKPTCPPAVSRRCSRVQETSSAPSSGGGAGSSSISRAASRRSQTKKTEARLETAIDAMEDKAGRSPGARGPARRRTCWRSQTDGTAPPSRSNPSRFHSKRPTCRSNRSPSPGFLDGALTVLECACHASEGRADRLVFPSHFSRVTC